MASLRSEILVTAVGLHLMYAMIRAMQLIEYTITLLLDTKYYVNTSLTQRI
jgi:hypothetical protein